MRKSTAALLKPLSHVSSVQHTNCREDVAAAKRNILSTSKHFGQIRASRLCGRGRHSRRSGQWHGWSTRTPSAKWRSMCDCHTAWSGWREWQLEAYTGVHIQHLPMPKVVSTCLCFMAPSVSTVCRSLSPPPTPQAHCKCYTCQYTAVHQSSYHARL